MGRVGPRRIDTVNVLQATWCAMRAALARLRLAPGLVLVDGNLRIPGVTCAQRAIIAGDRRSASVAAASILAKVARDSFMLRADRRYPEYGFRQHKGYATAAHLAALARLGPCPLHRRSFHGVVGPGDRGGARWLSTSSSGCSDVSPTALERPLVPRFLLAGFADPTGQLIAERRDRTRRRLVLVDAAVAELGRYALADDRSDAPALARLLAEMEARGDEAVQRITAGAFPPREPDRAALALVLAAQLLLGRYHRAEAGRVGDPRRPDHRLDHRGGRGEEEEAGVAEDESEEADVDAPEGEGRRTTTLRTPASRPPPPGAPDVMLPGRPPEGRSLASMPALARQLAARTWQVVRFPTPVLLTSDTPVVLWAPSAAAKVYQVGLGSAHEVRVPLDARHALIVARRAPAGEIVRDLGERHARALNRTVAEGAAEWMYYHPASDPLEGVELPSVESA